MKIIDTYGDTLKAILGKVYASPLLSCCRQKNEIERILAEKDIPAFSSFEFNRAGTNVVLYLYADPDFSGGLVFDKETEDDFNRFTFRVEVNWPCHGGADPATALARLAFYEQVSLLAAEIHAEFCGMSRAVYKFFRTKAQREAAKAEEQAKKCTRSSTRRA